MPYCSSVQKNVTHKTRRNMAMIPYSQCDILNPKKHCKICYRYVGKFDLHPLYVEGNSTFTANCLVL